MKHYKTTIAAVALAIIATEQAAQASLTTAASGTGNFVFGDPATSTIPVTYDVVFDSSTSLYTYLYEFTPIAGHNIGQFTVNAQYVTSVLTAGTVISGSPYTLTGSITDSGTSLGNVSWVWDPYTPSEQFLGFTSLYGPGYGAGSLNDDSSGPWGDNPGATGTPIEVPTAPVPEASTLLSGAMLLLPFGLSAMRSLRKERNI
jgi:hypothetical protein